MSSPTTFSHLLPLNPTTSHTYTTYFHDSFCIGTVPNGGYIATSFLLAAHTHMATTHPGTHCTDPINLHLEFVRRTAVGPATFVVRDVKLGARISNLHIVLRQRKDTSDPESEMQDEVEGYVTLTSWDREVGVSRETGYELYPRPVSADLERLGREGADERYIRRRADPYGGFRRAALNVEMFLVRPGREEGGRNPAIADQWVRFWPLREAVEDAGRGCGGSGNDKSVVEGLKVGTTARVPGRWTNDALGFLVDIFPQLNERYFNAEIEDAVLTPESEVSDEQIREMVKATKKNGEDGEAGPPRTFWYPTLLLNLDVKKRLPEEGVEWLFVRVQAKAIRRGRFDLNVEVWDEGGQLVALSTHANLIVDAARNMKREKKKESKM